MADPTKFTAKEVLNKVLLDSSGNAVSANSVTSQEALSMALDATNNRLNVALEGGTISGDVTIAGDLTVNGGGSMSYSEVLTGDMKITNTAASTAFEVEQNTGAGTAVLIDQNTNAFALSIDAENTTSNTILVESDALTTGGIARFYSNSSSTGTRNLVQIVNDHASATGTTALNIQQDSTGPALVAMGDVGIGMTPASRVSIKANGDTSTVLDIHGRSSDDFAIISFKENASQTVKGQIKVNASDSMIFRSGPSTDVLTLDTSQNATFAGNISLADDKALTLGSDSDAQIWNDGSNTYVRNNTSDQDIIFQVNDGGSAGTEVMRIDASSASVGIGVASPYNLLHIRKSAVSGSDAHDDDLLVIEENGDHCNINMISDTGSYLMFSDATRNVANLNYQHSSGEMSLFSETTYSVNVADGNRFKLDANSRISLSNNDSSGAVGTTLFGYKAGLNIVSGAVSNTFIGHEVADATLTNAADYNTGVGGSALSGLTSGYSNAALGFQSLFTNTDGFQNTAIGTSALYHNAGTDNNTAVGDQAGFYTTGANNTYVGQSAGRGAAGAESNNVGVGANALLAITSATYNTSVGSGSGDALTTGAFNTSIGAVSLSLATTALNNTAIGFNAMSDVKAGVAVDGCVAIGKGALIGNANNTTGINNTVAIGTSALAALTSGAGNSAVGYQSLLANVDGYYNTALGYGTLKTNVSGAANTAVGHEALVVTTGNNNTGVGFASMKTNAAGSRNTGLGQEALFTNATAHDNTSIGYQSGYTTTGADNVYVGAQAGKGASGAEANNVGVGSNSLKVVTTGGSNVAIGKDAMVSATANHENVAIGFEALGDIAVGEGANVAIGYYAMRNVDEGTGGGDANYNVAIGYDALKGGDFASNDRQLQGNVAIGSFALDATADNAQTGTVAIGYESLTALTSGANNTAVGYQSLHDVNTGGSNVALGNYAGDNITDGTENTCIGYAARTDDASATNQTVIGRATTGVADNSVTLGNSSVTSIFAPTKTAIQSYGTVSITDGSTITLAGTNLGAAILCIYESSGGIGGVFALSYQFAAVQLAGSSDTSTSDSAGDVCVINGTNNHTVTIKNNTGAQKNFRIMIYSAALN